MNIVAQPTIIVELVIKNHKVDERVSYTNHRITARALKEALQKTIKAQKKARGKGDGKGPDHSEDLDHNSWVITEPGEIVVFRCQNNFNLKVDYDTHVCPPLAGAPHDPFGWEGGVQQAKLGSDGYEVRGIAVDDELIFEQMFYKFTADIEGIGLLDPDGICGSVGH
jgi:hypothetical protein